ncbi:MAG: gliding motility-associated C-terminal domain-containing protein [Cyclobacteriaceae bacterium]|nr:MAG: gliding motility-associated C-terminal domain-containing protein [Cyclobacteriaceae bacterium]
MIFLSKLDAAGNFVTAASMGGSSLDQGRSVTVDASDNIYLAGSFLETADFDPDPDEEFNVTYTGNATLNSDAFLLKLGSSETPNNPGALIVFNAVSSNGDELNALFLIQNIDALPDTEENQVTIYNRWGDVVFEVSNYNNDDRAFRGVSDSGKDLPFRHLFL